MSPIKIEVTGKHSVSLPAERGILHLHISSTGPIQSQVSQTVTATSNILKARLVSLSQEDPFNENGHAVTNFTMSSLNTGSWFEPPLRTYTASTNIEVTFQDFKRLGAVATEMAEMTGVEVRMVQWTLTEETKAKYTKIVRQGAVRDAMEKAGDFATAAGKDMVTALEIAEVSAGNLFGSAAPGQFGSGGKLTRVGGTPQEQRLSFEPERRDVACQVKAVFEAM